MSEALKKAKLAGFYIPDLEDYYSRYDNFQQPRWFVYDPH